MKNMSRILLSITILFCLTACKKKDEESLLPEASHSGANTLGFLLNGQAESTSGKPDNVFNWGTKYYNWYDTTLEIGGVPRNWPRFNLSIRFPWNRTTGVYPLTFKYPCRATYMNYPDGSTIPTGTNQYTNDDQHTGQVTITYWDGYILAGTFEMNLVNDSGEVVHITSGRFDIGN